MAFGLVSSASANDGWAVDGRGRLAARAVDCDSRADAVERLFHSDGWPRMIAEIAEYG